MKKDIYRYLGMSSYTDQIQFVVTDSCVRGFWENLMYGRPMSLVLEEVNAGNANMYC